MSTPVSLIAHGAVALLRIDNPPVNALSSAVIACIAAAIDSFEADRSFAALLLHC